MSIVWYTILNNNHLKVMDTNGQMALNSENFALENKE